MAKKNVLVTKKDILNHAEKLGNKYAVDLLICAGPDGFDGTYSEYKDLLDALEENT